MPIQPLVSVVMPVHNGQSFLSEAVISVLSQTLSDWELIIVNDGSSDCSGEIARSFCQQDNRVRLINDGRLGFVGALNCGVAAAKGRYLARMDADDIAIPRRLAHQVSYLESHPELAACGSDIEVFGASGTSRFCLPRQPCAVRCHLFFYCCLSHPTVMLRRDVLKKFSLSYRPEYDGASDYDLWCRLDRSGLQMANIPDVLLRYRRHAAQITTADGDRQVLIANRIRREHLSHYGIEISSDNMEIHAAIGRWDFRGLALKLPNTGRWLAQLAETLPCVSGVPARELKSYLGDIWYGACSMNSDIGWPAVQAYVASPLVGRISPRAVFLALRSALKCGLVRVS